MMTVLAIVKNPHVCLNTYVYVCMCTYIYIYIHTYMPMYIYIYTYLFIYTHKHTCWPLASHPPSLLAPQDHPLQGSTLAGFQILGLGLRNTSLSSSQTSVNGRIPVQRMARKVSRCLQPVTFYVRGYEGCSK